MLIWANGGMHVEHSSLHDRSQITTARPHESQKCQLRKINAGNFFFLEIASQSGLVVTSQVEDIAEKCFSDRLEDCDC